MRERTLIWSVVIFMLATIAVVANLDLVVAGYAHPPALLRLLQPHLEPARRSLRLREGLDLKGGLQVLLQAEQQAAVPVTPELLERAKAIIENRVNGLGVTEPVVQTQGVDKIVVELPGVSDPDQAIQTIGKTALLEFIYSGTEALAPSTIVETTNPLTIDLLPEGYQEPYLGNPDNPARDFPESWVKPDDIVIPGRGVNPTRLAPTADANATAASAATPITGTSPTTTTASTDEVTATDALTATEGLTATDGTTATTGTTATLPTTSTAAADATAPVTATDAVTATEPISTGIIAEDETLYPTVLTGDELASASVTLDENLQYAVSFQVKASAAARMQRFTSQHLQKIMPIILDNAVISSPTLQGAIGAEGQITGQFTKADAESLAAQINSGSLPLKLNVVGQTAIGPTLGSSAISSAVNGGVLGLLVVMLFMLLYYRVPGIVANVALLLYTLFSLTIFRMLPVTLTLAGIAGFVLSIGMAVDANILIFERMKEELRAGRRIAKAMESGFERAWPSIRDSNASTLITCVILFWFGNQFGASIVKGFAVTLALGVLTSMFTAIIVTRLLLKASHRLGLHEGDDGAGVLESSRLRAMFGI
ncbi:MAG: protein translocase subunit SecD [Ardenticatenales bacterium]|nr:protein translocase subunit SecD [Ardenticatenales bacterium]